MTDSVPPSQVPQQQPPRGYTPEEIAYMKAQAMNEAVKRVGAAQPQTRVVYQKRNLTVAEWLVTLLLATGIVAGIQGAWYVATDILPRVEIRQR
jgi:hypothetical protein